MLQAFCKHSTFLIYKSSQLFFKLLQQLGKKGVAALGIKFVLVGRFFSQVFMEILQKLSCLLLCFLIYFHDSSPPLTGL